MSLLQQQGQSEAGEALDEELISSVAFAGAAVYSEAGERIGLLDDIRFGRKSGEVHCCVVRVDGADEAPPRWLELNWEQLDYDDVMEGYVAALTKDEATARFLRRDHGRPQLGAMSRKPAFAGRNCTGSDMGHD